MHTHMHAMLNNNCAIRARAGHLFIALTISTMMGFLISETINFDYYSLINILSSVQCVLEHYIYTPTHDCVHTVKL